MAGLKHEWRKKEKDIYIPKNKPQLVEIPSYNFLTIYGEGSPSSEFFAECITALYSLSYTIKMSLKKEPSFDNYVDYTVYPLEGLWSLNEEAIKHFDGTINKEDFVYDLMIRQPEFITEEYIEEMRIKCFEKGGNHLVKKVKFQRIAEGKCIQMLHFGSYDNEPASFAVMEEFAKNNKIVRKSKMHREIYLSDFRKVTQEKLKTTLRFQVES